MEKKVSKIRDAAFAIENHEHISKAVEQGIKVTTIIEKLRDFKNNPEDISKQFEAVNALNNLHGYLLIADIREYAEVIDEIRQQLIGM